jgi:hypothetical protein
MNTHLRTSALIAAGIVSAGSAAFAEEGKMSSVETALTSTTISGYVSTSAFFDLQGNSGTPRLPGRVFDLPGNMDRINLDVVKLTIEKPLDEGDWSAGYKVDLLFGPDANVFGTSSILGAGNQSDFTIKQAYVNLQTPVGNDLTVKVGVFDTIIGYEVMESPNNPNFSRSYAYFIEPFQHTGALLSYALTDWLSLNAGIANAWDTRINATPYYKGEEESLGIQTFMGSVAITVPEDAGFLSGTSIYGGIVSGLGSQQVQGQGVDMNGNAYYITDGGRRNSYYAGATIPTPLENLSVGLAYDYRTSEAYQVATGGSADQWAQTLAGYLSYKLTEQLKLNLRGEWAKGTAGTWFATPGIAGPQESEELFGLTTTLDISLWANVLTRIEFRWDNDLANTRAFGGTGTDEADNNAFILGANVVYKF